jgi:hypothetical protein
MALLKIADDYSVIVADAGFTLYPGHGKTLH